MSEIDFEKFDLDGLSLEDVAPLKESNLEPGEKAKEIKANDAPEKSIKPNAAKVEEIKPAPPPEPAKDEVELEVRDEKAESGDDQMTCPKCELLQAKAEQCSNCGIYVEKALAQIGKSKIQITATKF